MGQKFLDIEDVPTTLNNKVKQDLKFRTGRFVWRVKFNTPLNPSSINKKSMYLTDMEGNVCPAAIRYNPANSEIEVEPLTAFAEKTYYNLNITTLVKSKGGQHLKAPITIKFKID